MQSCQLLLPKVFAFMSTRESFALFAVDERNRAPHRGRSCGSVAVSWQVSRIISIGGKIFYFMTFMTNVIHKIHKDKWSERMKIF